jgi:hypothetical protein
VTQKLLDIVEAIVGQGGKPDSFDALFEEGCISASNKYHLFTFFFRFYFSLVYSSKDYKQAVIDKLTKEKAKY